MQVITRARGGCVIQRCQNKNPIERLTSGCEWRHAPEARAEDLGDFEKVSWVEFCFGRRRLAFACSQRPCDGCARIERSQNRKNVYLSPYVDEPLNSNVIKSFVPELRSIFRFRDSYVLCIYIWTLYVHFTYPYLAMVQIEYQLSCKQLYLRVFLFNSNICKRIYLTPKSDPLN